MKSKNEVAIKMAKKDAQTDFLCGIYNNQWPYKGDAYYAYEREIQLLRDDRQEYKLQNMAGF